MRVLYQGHSRRNGWNGPDAAMQPIAAAAAVDSRRELLGGAASPAAAGQLAALQQQQHTWRVSVWAEARGDTQAQWFKVAAHDSMTVRLLKRELLQQGLGRGNGGDGSSSGSSVEGRLAPSMLRIFERNVELQVRVGAHEAVAGGAISDLTAVHEVPGLSAVPCAARSLCSCAQVTSVPWSVNVHISAWYMDAT